MSDCFTPKRPNTAERSVLAWRLSGMTEEEKLAAQHAREARRQAKLLPDGPVRDALLEKAKHFEASIKIGLFAEKEQASGT